MRVSIVPESDAYPLDGDVAREPSKSIDAQAEPVILVGHSYGGGAVITGARQPNPNVAALSVYNRGPLAGRTRGEVREQRASADFPADRAPRRRFSRQQDGFSSSLDREKFP